MEHTEGRKYPDYIASGMRLAISAAIIAGTAFVLNFSLSLLAIFFAPTEPDVHSGRVVPWSNHGTYNYVTVGEDEIRNWLTILFAICFLVSFVIVF